MIDFIYSKVGLIVAALLITSVMLGVFAYQRRQIDTITLHTIGENLSSLVNEVCTIEGEVKWLLTFDEQRRPDGTYFPPTVGGDPYTIRISPDMVFLEQDQKLASSRFSSTVHVWNPGDMRNITTSDLAKANDHIYTLEFEGGYDLFIESRYITGSGYETFIYLEDSESFQSEVNRIGRDLKEFYRIRDPGELEDTRGMYTDVEFTAYKGIIVFDEDEDRNFKSLYIVNIDHTWHPTGSSVTQDYLNDRDHDSYQEISGSFWIQRKLINIDTNGNVHVVVRNFLYS